MGSTGASIGHSDAITNVGVIDLKIGIGAPCFSFASFGVNKRQSSKRRGANLGTGRFNLGCYLAINFMPSAFAGRTGFPLTQRLNVDHRGYGLMVRQIFGDGECCNDDAGQEKEPTYRIQDRSKEIPHEGLILSLFKELRGNQILYVGSLIGVVLQLHRVAPL